MDTDMDTYMDTYMDPDMDTDMDTDTFYRVLWANSPSKETFNGSVAKVVNEGDCHVEYVLEP